MSVEVDVVKCRACVSDIAEFFRRLGEAGVDIIHGRDLDAKARIDDALLTIGGMYYGCLPKETKDYIKKRLSETFKEIESLKELPRYKVPRELKFQSALMDIQNEVAREAAKYCLSVFKEQVCTLPKEKKEVPPA